MWPDPRIWSHLLKKYLVEIFIFCAVEVDPEKNKDCWSKVNKRRVYKTKAPAKYTTPMEKINWDERIFPYMDVSIVSEGSFFRLNVSTSTNDLVIVTNHYLKCINTHNFLCVNSAWIKEMKK